MKIDYHISDVAPYINWTYFFHAWGISSQHQDCRQLQEEAEARLQHCNALYQTHALFLLLDAHSEGDDIIVDCGQPLRISMLRQQQVNSSFLCLTDFVNPVTDKIGVFATTVDRAMQTDFNHDPYEKLLMQLLADRLAEATAERLHEEVRKHYWGYAGDEQLTMEALHQERFQGIRPAVGYPSLPDISLNFTLDQILHLEQIDIELTENGAMNPHASVTGLMLAHPEARYFSVGTIGLDQLTDYARRRCMPTERMRHFLSAYLQ